jgi:galactitol-specific phosphotransferase system IIB component
MLYTDSHDMIILSVTVHRSATIITQKAAPVPEIMDQSALQNKLRGP